MCVKLKSLRSTRNTKYQNIQYLFGKGDSTGEMHKFQKKLPTNLDFMRKFVQVAAACWSTIGTFLAGFRLMNFKHLWPSPVSTDVTVIILAGISTPMNNPAGAYWP